MELTIATQDLSRALYRVQGVADKKSTIPALAHALLRADEAGRLTVSATDLEVGISGTYEADVRVPGAVAIPARSFFDVVKSLSAEDVRLSKKENNWLEIASGKSRFRLVGMSGEEYPALPQATDVETFAMPAATLQEMIDQTIFCVSTDDNRRNLSGIYCIRSGPRKLRMVSTDGHRLALSEREVTNEPAGELGVIVPRKGFQELRRVLSDGPSKVDEVEMGFSRTAGILRAGKVTISTRLVEGRFPDYEQVIPKDSSKRATLPRSSFAEALRRVSLISQSRGYGVRLAFSKGEVELSAEDPEAGEASESLDIGYEGEPLTIGFNARYILDVLGLLATDEVRFDLSDDLSPGILRPGDFDGFLAVVMPMRI